MRWQSSCRRRRPQSTEELQQSSITFTRQSHYCFRVKRGFKVYEFTQTRKRDKTEKNTAEAIDNNASIRVAGSSRRVDTVYRQRLAFLHAHPEIHQWGRRGVIMHGSHLPLHYSRTQAGVALSSAEAELNAALKMGCEKLGMSQFCSEFG